MVINHWTVASLQREAKQFRPVSTVQACSSYFVISVLNAEIITFVKTFNKIFLIVAGMSYFIAQRFVYQPHILFPVGVC